MDERQIGLALALRELGIAENLEDFDSRLILQKTVYLIEEAGIKLGYSFNWYLRGPYSPSLTRDLFGPSSSDSDVEGWELDEQSKQIAERLRSLISRTGEDRSVAASRLELAASLHFLSRRGRVNIDDPEEAVEQLAQNGKNFSRVEVIDSIRDLRAANLL